MLPFNDPRSVGKADRRAGVAAVDVNTAAKRGNSTFAHEVGHLFDLDDKYRRDDDGNVTDKGPRGHIMSAWHRGRHVTKEECRKIWDSIDRFRGS